MDVTENYFSYWLSLVALRTSSPLIKKKFRQLETLSIKIVEVQSHQLFNKCCLTNNLLPTYTNINLHDEAARTEEFTLEFRKQLIRRQIEDQTRKIDSLTEDLQTVNMEFETLLNSNVRFKAFSLFLNRIVTAKKIALIDKHNGKLSRLYGSPILMPEERKSYINLSTCDIDSKLAGIFDLGMNCHLRSKHDLLNRKIEIEKLYRSISNKADRNIIKISNNEQLKCELKRFGLKRVEDHSKNILNRDQIDLIKNFKNNPNVIVRKADKSNIFVILNKEEYVDKINVILEDSEKFVKIDRDTTPQLKKKLRQLIETLHASSSSVRLPMPVGHYEPGYIYGNPKVHKRINNPPLRPIISQIGTATYDIAKKLNEIIEPYMPTSYMIKSTQEFINITKTCSEPGYLASLDVESLFTNVPVKEAIDIILDCTYNNPNMAPPDMPKQILKSLLTICTTETPFRNLNGDIYLQKDGVSMGSPLGPLLANFYMCFIENSVIPGLENSPLIYTRYVDDIFLFIKNIKTLDEIKRKFENISILKFTYEIENKKTIAFLDVNVTRTPSSLQTSVYTKATNNGECINYLSIAPDRYKTGVIRTLLHRAYTICSSWVSFHAEIRRISQVLTNNNFPMALVENEINKFITRKQTCTDLPSTTSNEIVFFFKNQMTSQYKQDEATLKKIIDNNVLASDPEQKIKLLIYYKNKRLRNLFIKNNQHTAEHKNRSHLVYQYACKKDGCQPSTSYIGYTECTLVDRLRNHTQNGAIRSHNIDVHNAKISTEEIVTSTTILRQYRTKDELIIAEALLIKDEKPALNQQREGEARVLSVF